MKNVQHTSLFIQRSSVRIDWDPLLFPSLKLATTLKVGRARKSTNLWQAEHTRPNSTLVSALTVLSLPDTIQEGEGLDNTVCRNQQNEVAEIWKSKDYAVLMKLFPSFRSAIYSTSTHRHRRHFGTL